MDALLFYFVLVCVAVVFIAAVIGFILIQIKARLFWRLLSLTIVLVGCCWFCSWNARETEEDKLADTYGRGFSEFLEYIDEMNLAGRTNDVHQCCQMLSDGFGLSVDDVSVSYFDGVVSNAEALAEQPASAAPKATNFICFRPCGNMQTKPLPILMILDTNTEITAAVRIAGLWAELWPATRIYLSPGDLQETIAQMKPVALRCAGITNSGYYDMAVTIDDSGSIFTNTVGQTDMCHLLQTIPQHILQENKLFNHHIEVEKTIEDCEPLAPTAR